MLSDWGKILFFWENIFENMWSWTARLDPSLFIGLQDQRSIKVISRSLMHMACAHLKGIFLAKVMHG